MYAIIDNKTKMQVATRKTRAAAARYADKLDLAYGAVRYIVRRVE